ncbi:unnamed protein product, partial [Brenthis ino]
MTTILCFSAVGNYMPPMFIFPRKRMKPELLDGAPAGSWGECHESGWIQGPLFVLWLKRFIEWSHSTKDNPALLLLDGHAAHVKSVEVIDLARENGVILLCFPPHCTHRLQPLDVGFMRPISTYYSSEIKNWLRSHPGRVVTQFQTAGLFGKAFVSAATMTTAINAFRTTGIWPINKDVFTDVDFAPADTTDNPEPTKVPLVNEAISQRDNTPMRLETPEGDPGVKTPPRQPLQEILTDNKTPPSQIRQQGRNIQTPPKQPSPQPGCSWMVDRPSNFATTPEQIMPVPKENRTSKRVSKQRGKTAIITESPYKNELLAIKKTAELKEQKKRVAKDLKLKSIKQKKRKVLTKKGSKSSAEEYADAEDAECIYCGYLWSESTEGWIRCLKCSRWAHYSCAGEDEKDEEATHLCALCIEN